MKKTIFAVCVAAVAMLVASCSPELPKAIFSYEVEELTVTFTNLSKDAVSYQWEFGDGQTSTEANPVHTYAENGSYTVTLTATNKGGDSKFTDNVVLSVPLLKIDGKFDDWQALVAKNHPTLTVYENPAGEPDGTAMNKIFYAVDDAFLYFALNYNDNDANGEIMSWAIYFDADGDAATGKDRGSYWSDFGADYLIEFGNEEQANATDDEAAKYACWNNWSSFQLWLYPEGESQGTFANQDVVKGTNGEFKFVEGRVPLAFFSGHGDLSSKTRCGARSCSPTWSKNGALPAVINGETQQAPALKFPQ